MSTPDPRPFIFQQLDGQWQKLAAVMLWKFAKETPLILSTRDFEEFRAWMAVGDKQFLTWGHVDSIELRLIPRADAERLVAHVEAQGGGAERS